MSCGATIQNGRSLASMAAPAAAETESERNLRELEVKGFTVVHNVFTKEQIDQLRDDYQLLKKKAENIMESSPGKMRIMEENNQKIESRYWKQHQEQDTTSSKIEEPALILQAGKGRYDLYKGFGGSDVGAFGTDMVLKNPVIGSLIEKLLISEYTSYTGVILSTVGSSDQYWHRDTDTLNNTNTNGGEMVKLNDFYFTCLVPCIVPFNTSNGATEFVAGSHRLAADEFPHTATTNGGIKLISEFASDVPLGSALLFNGKCNHRGTANNSTADRPAIYTVYHKMWYNDQYRKGIE